MKISCQLAAILLLSFAYPCVSPMAQPAHGTGSGLVVAVSSPPRTLDPATASDAAGARILQLTHPALLGWNTSYQPVGLVAEGCTQPTLTAAVCRLPTAAVFPNGRRLTAAVAAQWFQALQSNKFSPFTQLRDVSITAPNPTTLAFALPKPTLGFLGFLTEIPFADPSDTTVGLGPYRLAAQDPLGTVTLATSRTDIPEKIVITPISDATTRLLKLKKGELDAVLNDLPPQLVTWAKTQGFSVLSTPGTSYSYIGLNLTNPALAKPEVREALTLALNRPALRQHLLGGMAEPASTLLPPSHPAAWAAPEEPFDPFTAENLLDESSLPRKPDNTRFTLTLLTSTDPFSQRVSQALQSQWQAVGIDVQLRPTEWASFYDAVKKGNFDAVMLAWTGEQQPAFYFHAFNGTQTPPAGLNRGRLNDAAVNALTQAVMDAPDAQTQRSVTLLAQQKLAEVRPYIPLYRRHQILVTRPGITGCTLNPNGFYSGLLTCRK